MVSPMFMVGSISGWAMVTRSATSGKWKFVPCGDRWCHRENEKPFNAESAEDAEESRTKTQVWPFIFSAYSASCALRFLLSHQHAAIYVQHVAGDVGRIVRGQKCHGVSHIFRRSHSSQRNLLDGVLLELVAQNRRHGGFDESGSNGVAGNVARADLAGNGHGEADQSCLRRSIVRLPGLSHLPEDAGDVDDASPALLEHRADDLLNREVGGSEIGLEDGIPVGALHAHDQLIAGDAGVVDQDIYLAELRDGGFDRGLDLLFVADIESKCARLAARSADFTDHFVQLFLIPCGDRNSRAVFGKAQGAGASNALRGASDQRYSS